MWPFNKKKEVEQEVIETTVDNSIPYKIEFYDDPEYCWVISNGKRSMEFSADEYTLNSAISRFEENLLREKYKVKKRILKVNTEVDKEIDELLEKLHRTSHKDTVGRKNIYSMIEASKKKYKRFKR